MASRIRGAKLFGGDLAALMRCAGLHQLARPQQAADVIGAVWRRRLFRHVSSPLERRA
jgi:hypothetical protein